MWFFYMNVAVRDVWVTKTLSTAQEQFTHEINVDGNKHRAYVGRSFIYSRKCDWDDALRDACESLTIQLSFAGYISEGIALCGKHEPKEAMQVFDMASMFTDQDSNTTLLLLMIRMMEMTESLTGLISRTLLSIFDRGLRIQSVVDLTDGHGYDSTNAPTYRSGLPLSLGHMIQFRAFEDINDSRITLAIRTRGIEPKIKYYLAGSGSDRIVDDLAKSCVNAIENGLGWPRMTADPGSCGKYDCRLQKDEAWRA